MAYGNILFPFIFQHLNKSKNTYHENACQMPILSFENMHFPYWAQKPNFKFFWNLKTWNNLQCLRRAIPQKTKQSSWLRCISPSEPSKLHFWMGFGGSLAKDKPDHHIYIEAVQLAKGHMGWDLPTSWSLPTSRHHVFFPLNNTMHGPRSKVFEWGAIFGSVIFVKLFFV